MEAKTIMNLIKFTLISSIVLCAIGLVLGQALGQEIPLGSMYEDQIVVCVPDTKTDNIQFDHICHLYYTDDLDWYQDSQDGSFFEYEDSFDMAVVD